jgi:hypothetical protein
MKSPRTARAGLTMIEVLVAAFILTAIVGMSSYLVWSSSRHVSSAEAALQLENSAREVLNYMVQELRQAKKSAVSQVVTTPIRILPPANLHALQDIPPYPLGQPFNPVPEDLYFDGVRFDIIDPRNTFSLDDFKKSQERITTIQYWWEVADDEQKSPPYQGIGPNGRQPEGKDNNHNGVVDDGVIMKMETTYELDRVTIHERKFSTVLRNVKRLKFRVPSATSSLDVLAGKPGYNSDRIEILIDLEIMDPKQNLQSVQDAPGKEALLLLRSVSAVVDFRN